MLTKAVRLLVEAKNVPTKESVKIKRLWADLQ